EGALALRDGALDVLRERDVGLSLAAVRMLPAADREPVLDDLLVEPAILRCDAHGNPETDALADLLSDLVERRRLWSWHSITDVTPFDSRLSRAPPAPRGRAERA